MSTSTEALPGQYLFFKNVFLTSEPLATKSVVLKTLFFHFEGFQKFDIQIVGGPGKNIFLVFTAFIITVKMCLFEKNIRLKENIGIESSKRLTSIRTICKQKNQLLLVDSSTVLWKHLTWSENPNLDLFEN